MFAGLRTHEVAKIRGEDVGREYIAVLGKGGRAASTPTHPQLWQLAQSFPRRGLWFPSARRPGQPYATSYIGRKVADRFRQVGIERGSIHRLRATYGTNLVRAGVNHRMAQTLMRHSSLETTTREVNQSSKRTRSPGLPPRSPPTCRVACCCRLPWSDCVSGCSPHWTPTRPTGSCRA